MTFEQLVQLSTAEFYAIGVDLRETDPELYRAVRAARKAARSVAQANQDTRCPGCGRVKASAVDGGGWTDVIDVDHRGAGRSHGLLCPSCA